MDNAFHFGSHWSFNLKNDAKRLGFVLARYFFAADIAAGKRSLLELGCSEGIGASILKNNVEKYTGVDLDEGAIRSAEKNFPTGDFSFLHDDFMGKEYGVFDAVVSLDVVEHILPEHEETYFETIAKNLSPDGLCIVGTPNITASPYASEASNMGHVNLFSMQRLVETLEERFAYVFPFGMNDEILHTGFASMSHYLLAAAFGRK